MRSTGSFFCVVYHKEFKNKDLGIVMKFVEMIDPGPSLSEDKLQNDLYLGSKDPLDRPETMN